ncbi:hypothetical protein CLU79DRAFT_736370 [Phycomyces nitens]|nr:hypothetical protein CLU79DRAFT_736370 [Phycomyces nitens]
MVQPSFVVFSGGSACNNIAKAFHQISDNNVCYILGVSDNGGSTSELLRVLGGPSIGDLRSRLTRLIDVFDTNGYSTERAAIRELLSYRLPSNVSEHEVKDEWAAIVEGHHILWKEIPIEKREAIRGFLTSFNFEILKRAHKRFNFSNGSIGNFFLTGARLFFGSLEAALFLFSALTGVSEPTAVVPVINTNHTATIAALLENSDILVGQCEISHPSVTVSASDLTKRTRPNPIDAFSQLASDQNDFPWNASSPPNANLVFSKHADEKLVSRIKRIYYINEYGQEIYPVPNPKAISHLSLKQTLVYAIGSLYTSIVPCLVLRNVGNTIAQSQSLKHKIFLLNGTNDRETGGYTALDFIATVTAALNESQRIDARRAFYQSYDSEPAHVIDSRSPPQHHHSFNSHPGAIPFQRAGSTISSYNSSPTSTAPSSYSSHTVSGSMPGSPSHHYPPFPDHLFYPSPPSSFITHLVYLHNSAIPVDVQAIQKLGIEPIVIKGTLSSRGEPVYDEAVLTDAIKSIVS